MSSDMKMTCCFVMAMLLAASGQAVLATIAFVAGAIIPTWK